MPKNKNTGKEKRKKSKRQNNSSDSSTGSSEDEAAPSPKFDGRHSHLHNQHSPGGSSGNLGSTENSEEDVKHKTHPKAGSADKAHKNSTGKAGPSFHPPPKAKKTSTASKESEQKKKFTAKAKHKGGKKSIKQGSKNDPKITKAQNDEPAQDSNVEPPPPLQDAQTETNNERKVDESTAPYVAPETNDSEEEDNLNVSTSVDNFTVDESTDTKKLAAANNE